MSASPVRIDESLGRRVAEKKARQYKRIRKNIRARGARGIIPYQVFSPKSGGMDISVDRMNKAPREHLAKIAERDAENDERTFYGWAVISCKCALQMGLKVRPSPIKEPPNPHHADIVFPDSVKDDDDKRKSHAQGLAENAEWLEWREANEFGRRRPNLRVV